MHAGRRLVRGLQGLRQGRCATGKPISSSCRFRGVGLSLAGQSVVVVDSATAARDALKKGLLLLPFRDLSKYEGPWDIYTELPRGLADSLAGHDFFRIVPTARALTLLSGEEREGKITKGRLILLGRELGADVVITGEIEELSMKRFRATVPIGGYRSYQGVVTVNLLAYNVIDGRSVGEYRGDTLLDSKRTGIVNPAAHVPLDREYYFLGEHNWGTDEFKATLVGQSVGKCPPGHGERVVRAHHAAAGAGRIGAQNNRYRRVASLY